MISGCMIVVGSNTIYFGEENIMSFDKFIIFDTTY